MGCDYYQINNTTIHFGENDTIGCLCTFHDNCESYLSQIDKITVYKLALLGAAVKMAHDDRDNEEESWLYIPHDIPQKLQDRVAELLGGVDFRSADEDEELYNPNKTD